MPVYAKCKMCGEVIDDEYLNGRNPTEAISDHLEQDHADTLAELEKQADPDSDTTGLSLAWDFYVEVTETYRKQNF